MQNINFNRYIFQNNDYLVNLTTKKVLPKNSSFDIFKENFFLEGQEQESLQEALIGSKKSSLGITLIPTWECNLRCSHCFVLHELLKEDKNSLNVENLISFIRRYKETHPEIKNIGFYFLGGEPALRAKENVETIKRIKQTSEEIGVYPGFAATSNGVDLNYDIFEFYMQLDSLTISLDGTKDYHDKQRKSPQYNSSFEKTLKTIKVLAKFGMRDKLRVQASLDESDFNENVVLDFYRIMLAAGAKFDRIHFGLNAPTKQNPEFGNKFIDVCKNKVYSRPCCKYRFMNNFIIDSKNNVYCDYFQAKSENLLGSLNDPISQMEYNHKQIIYKTMPVLNDEKCMKCPVIGACWGWCCNLVGFIKPSEHCDQEGLIKKIEEHSSAGTLVDFLNLNLNLCANK